LSAGGSITVQWVQKLAQQDWGEFQAGNLIAITAVARKKLWDDLVDECRQIVDSYEHEYLRRVYWTTEPITTQDDAEPQRTMYKARVIEKGAPDRIILELRFDTSLPGIAYFLTEPVRFSGVISLVLDERDEICLAHSGHLITVERMAKVLLAPVLFRVTVYDPQAQDVSLGVAQLRTAYGDVSQPAIQGRKPGRAVQARDSRKVAESKQGGTLSQSVVGFISHNWLRYAGATVLTAAVVVLLFLLQGAVPFPLFLLLAGAVALVSIQWGVGPAICAFVLAVIGTDYFFVEPLYEVSLNRAVLVSGFIYAAVGFLAYWLAVRRRSDGGWQHMQR
jgi:hypothetical protein